VQTQLGGILERVGNDGPKAFYRRLIADRLLEDMRIAGGTVSRGDLAEYRTYASSAHAIKGAQHIVYLPPDRLGSGALLMDLWGEAGRLNPQALPSPAAFAGAVHDLNAVLLQQYGVSGAVGAEYGSTGIAVADRDGNAAASGPGRARRCIPVAGNRCG
jgi:hypothetical protein